MSVKKVSKDLNNLVSLPRIISRFLGFDNIPEIVSYIKSCGLESYDYTDKSNFIDALIKHFIDSKISSPFNVLSEELLLEYDNNIKNHLDIINEGNEDIYLKHFQYLSVLFTEIYLDLYFKKIDYSQDFVDLLNDCVDELNKYVEVKFEKYVLSDINKLCFWVATGGGKTIIMHLNYLQYVFYSSKYKCELNNVILLNPNESLSIQHDNNFKLHNLPSRVTNNQNANVLFNSSDFPLIKIMDFNKIKDKVASFNSKKSKSSGNGVTMDYRSFKNNNLILVDEGHRGSKSEDGTWINMRKNIAVEGFTFEYSATFQDVMDKESKDFSSEYKKSILFNYSYKYFYSEGFGKEYDISNLPESDDESSKDYIMLGNLISFYEQKILFNIFPDLSEEFNIENPLWLLVGSSVNVKDDYSLSKVSDIEDFVVFLSKLKSNKKEAVKKLKEIFSLKAPINIKGTSSNFFSNKFNYLKNELLPNKFNNDFELFFNDLMNLVFYSNDDSKLYLGNIKSEEGEIGLKYGLNGKYFGLIYIGKGAESKLIKDICSKYEAINSFEDSFSSSLFKTLNEPLNNNLNLLLGAKKFIEGWDNFRISSMLLLNFAKSKGASAIQLFGRGVRLKGYNFSMKRSSALNVSINKELKRYIRIIETLNVFGIKAKYMEEFKEELESQGDIVYVIEKKIHVKQDPYGLINDDLVYLKQVGEDEIQRSSIILKNDDSIKIDHSIESSVVSLKSKELSESAISSEDSSVIEKNYYLNKELLNLVDWQEIYTNLINYKKQNKYSNICIDSIDSLKKLIEEIKITIKGNKDYLKREISDYEKLKETKSFFENLYSIILKKYFKKIYIKDMKSKQKIELTTLDTSDIIEDYNLSIYVDEEQKPLNSNYSTIMEKILGLKEDYEILELDELDSFFDGYNVKDKFLIKFNNHVYYPLLVADTSKSSIKAYDLSPAGLNIGEVDFVLKLKNYIAKYQDKNKKIILLRNNERKQGSIGFWCESEKYYPDFLMWIIDKKMQKLAFIDPKGMAIVDKQKVEFNTKGVKKIENDIKSQNPKSNFELYSFLISQGEIGDSEIREKPHNFNVFLKDEDYIDLIIKEMKC